MPSSKILADEKLDAEKAKLLKRTELLLTKVEGTVLNELKEEEEEIEAEGKNLAEQITGDSELEARIKAEDFKMRQRAADLNRKIRFWAQDKILLDAEANSEELNKVMAEARAIARYFGLDVAKLSKLYELGKKTIKNADFTIPDKLPPDKDESYRRYFESFFSFAHTREQELSEYREKNQEYKLGLFKKVTIAYIRALLQSVNPIAECRKEEPRSVVRVAGEELKSFACLDPVVEDLKAYVQAIQKIAEADSGAFQAHAETVVAEQILIADMAAGIPLVGDAMDFYSLYSGENMGGECLSRFEYGLTAFFAAIPFIPASWATQVIKRMGLEDALSRVLLYTAQSAEWGAEMGAGVAKRFGITAERLSAAREGLDPVVKLLSTEINLGKASDGPSNWVEKMAKKYGVSEAQIERARRYLEADVTFTGLDRESLADVAATKAPKDGGGQITRSAADKLKKPVNNDAALSRNLEIAYNDQNLYRTLPKELQEKMRKSSDEIVRENIDRLPMNRAARSGNFDEVKDASNMVEEHLDAFLEEAKEMDSIMLFRSVNPNSTELIRQHFRTKGMSVKGKSADWGPHAGFIPVDQKFSKMGNPGKKVQDVAEIQKYYDIVAECIADKVCHESPLTFPNGDAVYTWKGPDGEIPVVKRGDSYFKEGSDIALDVKPGTAEPMKVLAALDEKTGKYVPLTADYDLLAIGSKRDAVTPAIDPKTGKVAFNPETGYIDEIDAEALERINKAGERAGYRGGNLSHHGPENQYVGSPGALANDPYVTIVDPQVGMLHVPACDKKCMEKWCETSEMCGGLPICDSTPTPPCIHIDPDRLLKDYFHNARLRGFNNLRPNSRWDWGNVNGVSGWSPKVVLDTNRSKDTGEWIFGQYKMSFGVAPLKPYYDQVKGNVERISRKFNTRALKKLALEATEKLFTCPGKEATQ